MNSKSLCRICLISTHDSALINIFSNFKQSNYETESIANILMACAPVKILDDDTLPQMICSHCVQKLSVAHEFRIICIRSDLKLRKLKSNNCISQDNFVEDTKSDIKIVLNNKKSEDVDNSEATKETKTWMCDICNKLFKSSRLLQQHEYKIHNLPAAAEINLKNRLDLSKPQILHVKSKKATSENKLHKCSYCDKIFRRKFQVTIHERVHTGERPYVCDVCGKAFASRSNFACHKIIHTSERPYRCTVCDKTKISAEELKRHMRVHSDTCLYKCDICGQGFKWSSNKIKHMRRHRGERSHKCNFCEKTFYDACQLKEHVIIHTGERPYSCKICNISYKRDDHLRKHNKRNHKVSIL